MTELVRLYAVITPQENLKLRHAVGLPKSLSPSGTEPVAMPSARLLIIDETTDGVFLLRYSIDAEFAGDTWHPSVSEAQEQAAFEFEPPPVWTPVASSSATLDELVDLLLSGDRDGRRH